MSVAPATVVLGYYDAINAHNYVKAWALGGNNLSSNYNAWAKGYSGTVKVAVTILATSGDTVSVSLAATEANGAVATYQGTHTRPWVPDPRSLWHAVSLVAEPTKRRTRPGATG